MQSKTSTGAQAILARCSSWHQ